MTRRTPPTNVKGVYDAITPLHLPTHKALPRMIVDGGAGLSFDLKDPARKLPSWWVGGWRKEELRQNVDEALLAATVKSPLLGDSPWCLNVEHFGYAIAWADRNTAASSLRKLTHLLMLAHEAKPQTLIGMYQSVWGHATYGKATVRETNDFISDSGILDAQDWLGVVGYGLIAHTVMGVCEAKRLRPNKPVLVFFKPGNTAEQATAAKDAGADGAILWEWTAFKPLYKAQTDFCDVVMSVFK